MLSPQPEAALITYVWNNRLVNVGGFDPAGQPFALCSLRLLQDNDTPAAGEYYAQWMPYQVGQAQRTQDAEARFDRVFEADKRWALEELAKTPAVIALRRQSAPAEEPENSGFTPPAAA
jgi:hypothetical protein